MKKTFFAPFLIIAVIMFMSCDDVFKPVDPKLEGALTDNGYYFIITNIGDVNASRGGPMVSFVYTLYYAPGEHSEIPESDIISSKEAMLCPATGKWEYNTRLSGVYTFWVVGHIANSDSGEKTGPSNFVVLDFDQ